MRARDSYYLGAPLMLQKDALCTLNLILCGRGSVLQFPLSRLQTAWMQKELKYVACLQVLFILLGFPFRFGSASQRSAVLSGVMKPSETWWTANLFYSNVSVFHISLDFLILNKLFWWEQPFFYFNFLFKQTVGFIYSSLTEIWQKKTTFFVGCCWVRLLLVHCSFLIAEWAVWSQKCF